MNGVAGKGRRRLRISLGARLRATSSGRFGSILAAANMLNWATGCSRSALSVRSLGRRECGRFTGAQEQPNELGKEHQHAEQPQDRREDRKPRRTSKHGKTDANREQY